MKDVLKAYRRILRLTNLLPAESRGYYRNYARENFVNYKDETDPQVVQALLRRAYDHSVWVLNKYVSDKAEDLRKVCYKE